MEGLVYDNIDKKTSLYPHKRESINYKWSQGMDRTTGKRLPTFRSLRLTIDSQNWNKRLSLLVCEF
jgi:hypothetical protein